MRSWTINEEVVALLDKLDLEGLKKLAEIINFRIETKKKGNK